MGKVVSVSQAHLRQAELLSQLHRMAGDISALKFVELFLVSVGEKCFFYNLV